MRQSSALEATNECPESTFRKAVVVYINSTNVSDLEEHRLLW
jgi:hypothetical protein